MWWQVNGWTTGVELGFRFVLYKSVYLELTDKVAYAYPAICQPTREPCSNLC